MARSFNSETLIFGDVEDDKPFEDGSSDLPPSSVYYSNLTSSSLFDTTSDSDVCASLGFGYQTSITFKEALQSYRKGDPSIAALHPKLHYNEMLPIKGIGWKPLNKRAMELHHEYGEEGLWTAFVLAKYTKATLRQCDRMIKSADLSLAQRSMLQALQITDERVLQPQWKNAVTAARHYTNLFGCATPDLMDAWSHTTCQLPQYSFRTAQVKYCRKNCTLEIQSTAIRTYVSLKELQKNLKKHKFSFTTHQIDTIESLLSAYFNEYEISEQCQECECSLYVQENIIDRPPMSLMVEWPKGLPIRDVKFALGSASRPIEFAFSDGINAMRMCKYSSCEGMIVSGLAGSRQYYEPALPLPGKDKEFAVRKTPGTSKMTKLLPQAAEWKQEREVVALLLRKSYED